MLLFLYSSVDIVPYQVDCWYNNAVNRSIIMSKRNNQLLEKVEESTTVTLLGLGIALVLFGMTFIPIEYSYFRQLGLGLGISAVGFFIATNSFFIWIKAEGRWVKWVKYSLFAVCIVILLVAIFFYISSFLLIN